MRLASALGCSRETVGMSACGFDVSRPEAGVILAPGVHIHEAAFVPVAYFGVMDVGTRTAGSSGVSMGRHLRSGERVHLRAARRAQRLPLAHIREASRPLSAPPILPPPNPPP